ncbi:MAG: carcinine hydrolase/isopenicillin-N N-acyltransferase family protein, partial [Desulfomonilia bacterium]|nr:carcinine hydrolase/isopenicillin-N N-acyltransferase family protein [Desulfomonilia bacterium]
MCDTFAVRSFHQGTGRIIFGKNSDREPDETHCVVSIPRRTHNDGDVLTCTYIAIPQVRTTHAMVLSKPFWIWGAEMGVNEHGVVIGNEALFLNRKHDPSPGLIGMDLLRLALERSTDAHQAVQVIIDLLRTYGQAGPCGYRDRKFNYMNSFLIADRERIVVLETIGRDYAMKSYDNHAAISNCITLGRDWNESSLQNQEDVGRFENRLMTFFAGSRTRRKEALDFIAGHSGQFSEREAFSLLRKHYAACPNSGFNKDVCMHARGPLIRRSQTTGSMVVCLEPKDRFRIFITGSSAPCLSTFKPCLPLSLPADLTRGGASFSNDSYWWRHEVFHINVLMRYARVSGARAVEISDLEQRFSIPVPGYRWDSDEPLVQGLSDGIFRETEQMERGWLARMSGIKEQ